MMNVVFAALCLAHVTNAMFINSAFPSPFLADYDKPDQKIYRKDAMGRMHAFDVSSEMRYAPNGLGGFSSYNVIDISDPDPVFGNFVSSGFGGSGMNPGGLGQQMPTPNQAMTSFFGRANTAPATTMGGWNRNTLATPAVGGLSRSTLASPGIGGFNRGVLASPGIGGFNRGALASPGIGGLNRGALASPAIGSLNRGAFASPGLGGGLNRGALTSLNSVVPGLSGGLSVPGVNTLQMPSVTNFVPNHPYNILV